MKTSKSNNLNGTSLFFQFVQEGNDYMDTAIIYIRLVVNIRRSRHISGLKCIFFVFSSALCILRS